MERLLHLVASKPTVLANPADIADKQNNPGRYRLDSGVGLRHRHQGISF
jgi:hypothetical protein